MQGRRSDPSLFSISFCLIVLKNAQLVRQTPQHRPTALAEASADREELGSEVHALLPSPARDIRSPAQVDIEPIGKTGDQSEVPSSVRIHAGPHKH